MANRIAIVPGLLITGAVMLHTFLLGNEHFALLARKMVDLIEYLAFWR